MKNVFRFTILFLMLLGARVFAQDSYQELGKKALLDGNFKLAVVQLEKAMVADSTNLNALYMLGYSYYHAEDYKKSVAAFGKLISLKPSETSAYYYRGKARSFMANYTPSIANSEREKLLLSAIRDFSRAIDLNNDDWENEVPPLRWQQEPADDLWCDNAISKPILNLIQFFLTNF